VASGHSAELAESPALREAYLGGGLGVPAPEGVRA
jgi:hypothetical protein